MHELARGRAEAPGAGTIVNAVATGRGAAFAIDLKIVATVILDDSGKVRGRILDEPGEDTRLMEACVRGMLGRTDQNLGATVETKSDIPIARGLKSSSACCNATILAAASALRKLGHKVPPDQEILGLGIDASIACAVTITGAFDDACASYYGGAVVTDNARRRVLRKVPVADLEAVILVPRAKSYSGKVDVATLRLLAPQVEIAHREALEGDLFKAMTLNGLIYCASLGYDPKPALAALRAGALAAGLSGKGPAFVALCEKGDPVRDAWRNLGETVITTRTNNTGSKVLE